MLTLIFLFLAAGNRMNAVLLLAGYGVPQLIGKLKVICLFNTDASLYAQQWDKPDKQILHYPVEQERLRFAN